MHYPVINDKIRSMSHAISSPEGIFHANLNCKQKGIPKLLGEVFFEKICSNSNGLTHKVSKINSNIENINLL